MTEQSPTLNDPTSGGHTDEYPDEMVTLLEIIWGRGFLAPGGADNVARLVQGLDITGKKVLDIGCGTGGGAMLLAQDHGAQVTGIELEAALIDRARGYIKDADLGDQVDIKQVNVGPLDFPDESFDVVYCSGAFTQTEDKAGMFSEVLRVLKPGGTITSYDWMRPEDPYSEDMLYWFELEGLTYAMETPEKHKEILEQVGFERASVEDDDGWYAHQSQVEYAQLKGPLAKTAINLVGQADYDHFIENWRVLTKVLANGEVIPAFFRGYKPL